MQSSSTYMHISNGWINVALVVDCSRHYGIVYWDCYGNGFKYKPAGHVNNLMKLGLISFALDCGVID